MRYEEEIRYGFSLYPFALLMMLGVLFSSAGVVLVRSVFAGTGGAMFSGVLQLVFVLLFQALGTVTAAAGFFGALYKLIRDAKE